jgi:hypothetical protein
VTTIAITAALRSSPTGEEAKPPNNLEQAVGQLFGSQCVSPSEATEKISRILDFLGYSEWAIHSGSGVTADGCVGAGLVTSKKEVLLVPIARPELASALQGVEDEFFHRCQGREAAIELLSSVLRANHVNEFSISTDGPTRWPMGQEQAVATHLAAGCYIYSGSSRDGDGRPVYYISGRRP